MNSIRESIKPVIKEARHVSVDNEALRVFADSLPPKYLHQDKWPTQPLPTAHDQKDYVAYLILYVTTLPNTWGEPKWGLTINGKALGGSASIDAALRAALDEGYPLLDPSYLASMPEADLQKILLSNVEIPLLLERLTNLHILGKQVQEKFAGSFWNVLEEGNFSALGIVEVLTTNFPSLFHDEAQYHSYTVTFHKLARVVSSMLMKMHYADILKPTITGEEELTALADYKVPQSLHKLGLIRYTPELTQKLRDKVEFPYGSDEEIEIRAFTIHAIDEVVRLAKTRLPQANAIRIDKALWLLSQKPSPDDLPHHRTRTLWY